MYVPYNSMYHFLVQTLISLGEPLGRGFESLLQPETFGAFAKPDKFERSSISIFFRHYQFFSKTFLMSKGSPLHLFKIFCNKLEFQKAQRVSPFTFLGTMRLFQNSHFSSELRFSQYIPTNNFFQYYLNFDVI